jgi:hypothetical protein
MTKLHCLLLLIAVFVCPSLAMAEDISNLIPSPARFVEVMKHGLSDTTLHIGEIEVFACGVVPDELDTDGTSQNDLVQGGGAAAVLPQTTQQLKHGLEASVFDGDLESGADVWTTSSGLSTEPRYMIDLGDTHPIDIVRVWGRFDSSCQERLKDFSVTLYADNGSGLPGEVVATVRHDAQAPPASEGPVELSLAIFSPMLEAFRADHERIVPEEPIVFSWKVNPAFTSVSIDPGIGDVTAYTMENGAGSYTLPVGPSADTTYTLTVAQSSKTKEAPLRIQVTDQPYIRAFNSDPAMVAPGAPVQLSWDVIHTLSLDLNGTDVTGMTNLIVYPVRSTEYTLTATHSNGALTATRSVLVVPPGEAIISEFMADNTDAYPDEDLDRSDWIELHNPTAVPAELNGYYLTDDSTELTQWRIPDVTINPGEYLIIFASGKDRSEVGSPLHANFSLDAGGEYLALVRPDGTTVFSGFSPEFVKQKNGISYGYDPEQDQGGFLIDPTPGTENSESYLGFVKDTSFDVDRGFYDAPIQISITTPTDGATVRYTLDGSEPTPHAGLLWDGPVTVSNTTILRAAAFKPGYVSTDVDTHTYIFRSDIASSDVMDTRITQDPVYGPQMADALISIPSISIVSADSITRSEQACSMELIGFENGNTQENCGMARFGNYVTNFEKRNVRLYFRSEYGASKLNYPLFEGYESGRQPVRIFDRLDLRNGAHDMWQRGFYLSNRFIDNTLLEMGHLCTHGRFVHLYVNGVYTGQYHLRERWDAAMHAEYLGGEKEDYEGIASNRGGGTYSSGTAYEGDGSAWENVKALAGDYEAVSPYLNVTNYTDFLLLVMSGNAERETRIVGPVAPGSGFIFQMNDADGFTRSPLSASARADTLLGVNNTYAMLRSEGHPDFEMLIADRIHKHYFNDGVFTPARNIERLTQLGNQIDESMVAEVARWMNMLNMSNLSSIRYGYDTPDKWRTKRDAYITGTLPGLTATMVATFRAEGLYPVVDAPVFSQHGGEIEAGFQLTMTSPSIVYYTLDGSDPRLPGGDLSPTALTLSGESSEATLINKGAVWNYLDDGSDQGTAWTGPEFSDSGWASGPGELGYGDGGEATVVSYGSDSGNKHITTYFRHRIQPLTNVSGITSLTMALRVDDGAVVYVNGVEAVRVGIAEGPVTYQTPSTAVVSGADESTYTPFAIDPSLLVDGENVIAVEVHQRDGGSTDISFDMELEIQRVLQENDDSIIVLNEDTVVKARTRAGSVWSALNAASFVIQGMEPASATNLVMSEIHYNPDGSDEYEFIEFYNPSSARVDLAGVTITTGIHYTFPKGSFIGPGKYAVLTRDAAEFEARYQEEASPWYYPNIQVLGQWIPTEGLANSGERITVVDSEGLPILSVTYGDGGVWPSHADGKGSSLELVAPSAMPRSYPENNIQMGNASSWTSSSEYHGTPGRAGTNSTVVINEVLSHSDLGQDWIELRNTGTAPVNIGGWCLSDSSTNLMKYAFPGGTQIAANGYLTFTESQLGFAFSELGDDAFLSLFSGTNLIRSIDRLDFGAGDREVPFGRYVRSDGRTDFPALVRQTADEKNAYPLVGPIVISEIMYNPTNGPEFIELLNRTGNPVALYDEPTRTNTWKITSAVEYDFPQECVIPPYGIAVISSEDPDALRAQLSIPSDIQLFGPWNGSLNNAGETIKLSRPGDIEPNGFMPYILVDRVEYESDAPWPLSPDGTGPSLTRIAPYCYGNDPGNWDASSVEGGSPGFVEGDLHMSFRGLQLNNGRGRLQWAGIPDQQYVLDYRDSLSEGDWKSLPPVTAMSNVVELTDLESATNSARFYRVRWVQ